MSAPVNVVANPDIQQNPLLVQWISIENDGLILLRSGKVELGQGIGTVQLQIVADELDIPISQIRMIAGNTDLCVDQGYTSGSNSVQIGAMALRQICAEVRLLFLQEASRRFKTPVSEIQINRGFFSHKASDQTLSYRDMSEAVNLNIASTGLAKPKKNSAHTISGKSVQRPDLLKKIFGAGFIHDLDIEGMLHGRIVRPPSYSAQLVGFEDCNRNMVLAMPGVQVLLVCGRFVGVCATREEQAIAAAKVISRHLVWIENESLPKEHPEQAWLKNLSSQDSVVDHTHQSVEPAVQSLRVNYSKPFIAHASIGPSCALAHWENDHLTVWTHGQGSFPMRRELANLFDIGTDNITVIHADGAGCYGHNGADDAAFDAAMLAREAGAPVRLQWMREDEFSWSPHGSAMSVQIEAGINSEGKIIQWNQQIWSHTHVQRPGMAPGLRCLAGMHRDPPAEQLPLTDFAMNAGGGGQRNAIPLYELSNKSIDYHLVDQSTLRSSALRGLGAYANVFAIESCMDELASLAGQDPIAFRLKHTTDQRARNVLECVAKKSNWHQKKNDSTLSDKTRGCGIGFARYKNNGAYCAVVIEIEVTERIILDHIWVVVDAGEIIHPDGLINQIEGGVLQAASWTLKEALHWDQTRITTQSWDDYPILRFDETPAALDVHCIDMPDSPPLGAGECAAGPTAAAIANALQDAIGIRIRDLPMTPERLAQAVMQA